MSAARRTDQPAHSWVPVESLVAFDGDPPAPPSIGGLLYAGATHILSAEPDMGKSWIALALAVEELLASRTVLWIDFEMGAARLRERLLLFEIEEKVLDGFVLIDRPSEPSTGPEVRADLDALVREREPSLVVVDSFADALEVHGLEGRLDSDVTRFYRTVAEPLKASGAALLIQDHLVKNPESRGRFSTGSERKIGGCDVHLGIATKTPQLGRDRTGTLKIKTHKDRDGWLARPMAADFTLESSDGLVRATFTPAERDQEPWKPLVPTYLMQKVSEYVGSHHPGEDLPSRSDVKRAVTGRGEWIDRAIDALVEEGYLKEVKGPRGARCVEYVRSYTDPDGDGPGGQS